MLTALRASTKNAASIPSLSEDNPEQITKLPERFAALLTPRPPARGRIASLAAEALAKAATT
jgi:hypothetical protein